MECERKSKTAAQRFLFLSSQGRKHQTSSDHSEDSLYLSFWGSHPKSAACTHSHTLSFSSHCQGAEGGVHMGFKCQQPLGLPQAHPLHSHQVSLPDTPHLSLHRLFLRVKQSLLKANGTLLGLCFIPKPSTVSPPWWLHTTHLCLLENVRYHTFVYLQMIAWPSAYRGKAAEMCLCTHGWEQLLARISAQGLRQPQEPKGLPSFLEAS